jgi:hypothetical protein
LGPRPYAHLYWSVEAIDALLQLTVVAQVAAIVFRPLRDGIRARAFLLIAFAAAIALTALLLTLSVRPPARTVAGMLEIRGQLFTSILICSIFTIVLFFSQKLGLYFCTATWEEGGIFLPLSTSECSFICASSFIGSLHFGAMSPKKNSLRKKCEMPSCMSQTK